MDTNSIKKKAFSGVIWKFMERVIAEAVSLVVSIVIARIISPDDYSVVSIVAIFFAFANVIISGGLNTALIQKNDADILDYSTTFHISVILSVFIYAFLFAFAPSIAAIYNKPILISVIRIMGLILPVTAIKSIVCAYVSATLQFKKFFFATIGGTLFSAVVGIFMAAKGFGPWALVAQQMTNTTIDTIILIVSTRIKIRMCFSFNRFKELFNYGWKILVASLFSTLYNEINPLVVGIKFSPADLSFYEKGKSFPNYLSSTISSTLSAVMFPVMSKFQDDHDAILNHTRRFMKVCSFLVFPMMIGFLAISDNFVFVVLTEKWMPAAYYIKVFSIAYMFNIVCTGNLQTIRAIGRSDTILKLEIIKKSLYMIVIGCFILLCDSPEVLALSMLVNITIALIVNTIPNRRLIGYSYSKQIVDLLPNFFTSIIMGAIVYLMNSISINKLVLLIVQILIGAVVYIVENLIIKNESMFYLIDTLKSFKSRT